MRGFVESANKAKKRCSVLCASILICIKGNVTKIWILSKIVKFMMKINNVQNVILGLVFWKINAFLVKSIIVRSVIETLKNVLLVLIPLKDKKMIAKCSYFVMIRNANFALQQQKSVLSVLTIML